MNNVRKIPVLILSNDEQVMSSDYLASESLVKLNFAPGKIVNLLASPDCLEDLFIGHLIAEGYLNSNRYLKLPLKTGVLWVCALNRGRQWPNPLRWD